MTKTIHIASSADMEKAGKLATEVMAAGGVVLIPTDTTYTFGVNALNVAAVDRVFQLKGRDYSKPIHVVVRDMYQAAEYVKVSHLAHKIAEYFLPGALTLVLSQKSEAAVPPLLIAGGTTLGIRIPMQPVCQVLSRYAPFPYTTTSANRSNQPNTYDVESVIAQLGQEFETIELVLDAGILGGGVSTVIAVEDDRVQLIRQGAVAFSSILEFAESV